MAELGYVEGKNFATEYRFRSESLLGHPRRSFGKGFGCCVIDSRLAATRPSHLLMVT